MEIRQHGHRRASQSPPPPRWQAATRQRGAATRPGERLFGLRTTRADVSATVVRLSPTRTRGRRAAGAAPSGASLLPTWQRRPPSDRLSELVGARALTRRPSPPTMAPSWSRRGQTRRGARPPPLPPLAARRNGRRRADGWGGRVGEARSGGACAPPAPAGGSAPTRRDVCGDGGSPPGGPAAAGWGPPVAAARRRSPAAPRSSSDGLGAGRAPSGRDPLRAPAPTPPVAVALAPAHPSGLRPRAARGNAQRRDGVI